MSRDAYRIDRTDDRLTNLSIFRLSTIVQKPEICQAEVIA